MLNGNVNLLEQKNQAEDDSADLYQDSSAWVIRVYFYHFSLDFILLVSVAETVYVDLLLPFWFGMAGRLSIRICIT